MRKQIALASLSWALAARACLGCMVLAPVCLAVAQLAPASPPPAAAPATAERISLEEAIRLAIQHNHSLLAARTTILQNQANEITANLRPNPVLSFDSQFFPLFHPGAFNTDYLANNAQFDLGLGYLFERGRKRQHRLEAARDQTDVNRAQVFDTERQIIFNVSQQFVAALLAQSSLDFARQNLDSFRQTIDITQARYNAGDIAEGDLLKIKLQFLQFQSDLSAARLAKIQALAALRQLLGFESVPSNFDVAGDLDYHAVSAGLGDLQALALRSRPDLQAAEKNVTAARSQETLAEANGKRDLNGSFNYTHTAGISSGAFFFNMELPIFNRNQGEIARTRFVINQQQELRSEASQQVLTDVSNAFENLRTSEQIIQLYQGGYVDQARQSRDISQYSYKKGVASLLDYLDAERSYRANQVAYRQALANYMNALEQMRQAVGTRNLP